MINICLTFDYELFFGENYGTFEEVLFAPTDKLINLLVEENVKATFFADVCSIFKSKEFACTSYVDRFEEQICRMKAEGQDVQLHIHSHWLGSEFKDGKWLFDPKKYRIHSLGFENSKAENASLIILKGVNYLNEILRTIDNDYSCIAFRAGGYSLQPHKKLVEALCAAGIKVDSSVAYMQQCNTETNRYNYKHDISGVNWYIGSDKEWWENGSTSKFKIYEIPVAAENSNPLFFAIKRCFMPNSIKLNLGEKRGTYIGKNTDTHKKRTINSIVTYLCGYHLLSMDAYKAEFLYKQIKRFAKKNNAKENECTIALIGHPKLVNDEYINNLRQLLKLISCDKEMQIVGLTEVYATQNSEV